MRVTQKKVRKGFLVKWLDFSILCLICLFIVVANLIYPEGFKESIDEYGE